MDTVQRNRREEPRRNTGQMPKICRTIVLRIFALTLVSRTHRVETNRRFLPWQFSLSLVLLALSRQQSDRFRISSALARQIICGTANHQADRIEV